MPRDVHRVVLALGAYTLDRCGTPVRRGRRAVEQRARESFAGENVRVVSIAEFAGFDDLFDPTVDSALELELPKYAGAASGQFIQEALEGIGVTDVHMDLTGIEDALEQSQAASELRNLIAHLCSGEKRKVNIHYRHHNGLSTIRRDGDLVEGAPLPKILRKHMPSSIFPDSDKP